MTRISGQTVQDTIEVILESHLLPRQNLDKVSMGQNMRSGPTYFCRSYVGLQYVVLEPTCGLYSISSLVPGSQPPVLQDFMLSVLILAKTKTKP